MTEIPAKPILFSGPMIKALLENRKTQTRRVLNPQPSAGVRLSPFVASSLEDGHGREIKWKYTVGMRLWVRETWSYITLAENENADGCLPDGTPVLLLYRADDDGWENDVPWIPSIHMFRWASRITLEVTEVRVERLQSISEEDAIAEGVAHRCDYKVLWDEINGKKYPWAADPFCWVISFRRVESD